MQQTRLGQGYILTRQLDLVDSLLIVRSIDTHRGAAPYPSLAPSNCGSRAGMRASRAAGGGAGAAHLGEVVHRPGRRAALALAFLTPHSDGGARIRRQRQQPVVPAWSHGKFSHALFLPYLSERYDHRANTRGYKVTSQSHESILAPIE